MIEEHKLCVTNSSMSYNQATEGAGIYTKYGTYHLTDEYQVVVYFQRSVIPFFPTIWIHIQVCQTQYFQIILYLEGLVAVVYMLVIMVIILVKIIVSYLIMHYKEVVCVY